jgi:hypothetical protein
MGRDVATSALPRRAGCPQVLPPVRPLEVLRSPGYQESGCPTTLASMQALLTATASPVRSFLSLAGAAGIAVPVLMWTAFLVFGLTHPGYNLLLDVASRLGMKGTTNALIFNIVHFYAAGTLLLVFAAGLWAADMGRASRVAASIVALVGVAQILSGYFSLDPDSRSASMLHENLGLPPVLGIPAAAVLMAPALHGARRTISVGVAALLVLMILTLILLMALGIDVAIGLFQRLYIGVMSVWIVTVGLWLRNLDATRRAVG